LSLATKCKSHCDLPDDQLTKIKCRSLKTRYVGLTIDLVRKMIKCRFI
jgi:hypothetical protein